MPVDLVGDRGVQQQVELNKESLFQATQSPALKPADLVIAFIFGLGAAVFFYREIIFSRFDRMFGDEGDARLAMLLMEHWHHVFSGKASFFSPSFFYPAQDVIGYTDANFLFGIIFTVGRWLGLDPYGAFQLVIIVLGVLAYGGMFWLLRRVIGVQLFVSILFADLFAYSNLNAIQVGHMQLLITAFIPLLLGWGTVFWRRLHLEPTKASYPGYAAAVLYGLMLFTGFYICWFFALFVATATFIAVCLAAATGRFGHVVRVCRLALCHWRIFARVAVVFSIAAIPFFLAYIPQLIITHGYSVDDLFRATFPHPLDLINVGSENLVWGSLILHLIPDMNTRLACYELFMGMAPGFVMLLIVTTWMAIRQARHGGNILPAAVALSVWAGLLIIVQIHGRSIWWWIRLVVPGANAIRVVSRYEVVLYPFALIMVAIIMSGEVRRVLGSPRKAGSILMLCLIALFLLAEQVQPLYARYSKSEDWTRIQRVPVPPEFCRLFVVYPPLRGGDPESNGIDDDALVRRMQVDAIFQSMRYDIPTINGLSSLNPPQYYIYNLLNPYYTFEAGMWLTRNHFSDGICSLDMKRGIWDKLLADPLPIPMGVNLMEPPPELQSFSSGMRLGYSGFAAGGLPHMWTDKNARLTLTPPSLAGVVRIDFIVANPHGSDVSFLINGKLKRQDHFAPGNYHIELSADEPITELGIDSTTFRPNTTSDMRDLGILLSALTLEPSSDSKP